MISSDTMVVASTDHHVYFVNPINGVERSQYLAGNEIHASPLIANEVALVPVGDTVARSWHPPTYTVIGQNVSAVVALDANGERRWYYGLAGSVLTTPIRVESTAIVADGNGDVVSLRIDDGSLVWRTHVDSAIMENGMTFVRQRLIAVAGENNDALYIIDSQSGNIITRAALPARPLGVSSDGKYIYTVYVTQDGAKYSERMATLTLSGRIAFDEVVATGPKLFPFNPALIRNNQMLLSDIVGGGLISFNASNRPPKQVWKVANGRSISGTYVDDKEIFFGDQEGEVYRVDAATGRELAVLKVGDDLSEGSPAVAGGNLLVGGVDGRVFGIPLTEFRNAL